jgi:hypothetical protein
MPYPHLPTPAARSAELYDRCFRLHLKCVLIRERATDHVRKSRVRIQTSEATLIAGAERLVGPGSEQGVGDE